jgi:hypothetical protein
MEEARPLQTVAFTLAWTKPRAAWDKRSATNQSRLLGLVR